MGGIPAHAHSWTSMAHGKHGPGPADYTAGRYNHHSPLSITVVPGLMK